MRSAGIKNWGGSPSSSSLNRREGPRTESRSRLRKRGQVGAQRTQTGPGMCAGPVVGGGNFCGAERTCRAVTRHVGSFHLHPGNYALPFNCFKRFTRGCSGRSMGGQEPEGA